MAEQSSIKQQKQLIEDIEGQGFTFRDHHNNDDSKLLNTVDVSKIGILEPIQKYKIKQVEEVPKQ